MSLPSISHIGLSLVAGSLTTLSPCVFPVLPLVVGGAVQSNRLAPIIMAFGMVTSFSIAGWVLGSLGPQLGVDSENLRLFGAWMLLAFAVVMMIPAWNGKLAEWMSPVANSVNQASSGINTSSVLGSFGLGAILGIIWSPCSGPLLASTIAMVASGKSGGQGAITLGLFGLGASMPLVAIAYASRAGISKMQGWIESRMGRVKQIFAIVLGTTGLLILTGYDKRLEASIVTMLPNSWLTLITMF